MISLFLIALLGLFCCSSINNNALDHTKEIEVKEDNTKKAIDVDQNRFLYAMDEVFNVYNISNYYAWYPSFFDNGYTGNVVTYGNSTSRGVIDLWENINFNTIDASNTFVFDTIRLNIVSVGYTSSQQYAGYYRRIELKFYNSNTNTYFLHTFTFDYFSGQTRSGVDNNGYILNMSASGTMINYGIVVHNDISNFFSNLFSASSLDYQDGYNSGYYQGYNTGYNEGNDNGYQTGFQTGYTEGLTEGANYDDTALTIFTGFIEVGLLPVNIFLQILNFEVFGINIAGFVSALLTIAIVVIIVRMVTGKKDD